MNRYGDVEILLDFTLPSYNTYGRGIYTFYVDGTYSDCFNHVSKWRFNDVGDLQYQHIEMDYWVDWGGNNYWLNGGREHLIHLLTLAMLERELLYE